MKSWEKLSGGRSGALVYSVTGALKGADGGTNISPFGKHEGRFVVKLDDAKRAGEEKTMVDKLAAYSPVFAKHIPKVELFESESAAALLYQFAGGSIHYPISKYASQLRSKEFSEEYGEELNRLKASFRGVTRILLDSNKKVIEDGNETSLFSRKTHEHPQTLLRRFLDHPFPRSESLGPDIFLGRDCHADVDPRKARAWRADGVGILPNPWYYVQPESKDSWVVKGMKKLDFALTGLIHGDAHMDNILLKFVNPSSDEVDSLLFIDFSDAGYGEFGCNNPGCSNSGEGPLPLLFDNAYLELAFFLRANSSPLPSERDLALICSVLNELKVSEPIRNEVMASGDYQILSGARRLAREWVKKALENEESENKSPPERAEIEVREYSEWLESQWMLGGVCAGLNFTIKLSSDPKRKFLGFLWASICLKAFFGEEWAKSVSGDIMVLKSPRVLEEGRDRAMSEYQTLANLVKEKDELGEYERLIPRSYQLGFTTFVRRKDLEEAAWPDFAFEILTCFDLKNWTLENKGEGIRFQADISNANYGIYNNQGKEFLRKEFKDLDKLAEADRTILSYLDGIRENNLELSEFYPRVPIRWASAGYLARVEWNKRSWIMLFFRDLEPVGWNVANGASENAEELVSLDKVVDREFAEETVILEDDPKGYVDESAGGYKTKNKDKVLHSPSFVSLIGKRHGLDPARWQVAAHRELRRKLDYLTIDDSKKEEIDIRVKSPSPFRIKVLDGKKNFESEGFVSTINPFEFGTEAIKVCSFDLKPEWQIMDGEVSEGGKKLIRRPVGLFRYKWLKDVFDNNQLLDPPGGRRFKGCKVLPCVPDKEYHVFTWDIDARQSMFGPPPEKLVAVDEGSRFEPESNLMIRFQQLRGGGINDEVLRTLCPVTWKTLRLAFNHNAFPNSLI